jgi:hypothetical protein
MEGHLHQREIEPFCFTQLGKFPFAARAMNKPDRRAFLQTSAGALAASLDQAALGKLNLGIIPDDIAMGAGTAQTAQSVASNEGRKPLRLGLIIGVGEDPDASMAKVRDLGLPTCQAFVDDFKPGLAERLRQALDKHGIEATSLVVGEVGNEVWEFLPRTADNRSGSPGDEGSSHRAHQDSFGLRQAMWHSGGPDALRIYT